MLKRTIQDKLEKALGRSPIVLLNGARQVGKTTLVRELLDKKKYTYLTFDDEITYLAAKSNGAESKNQLFSTRYNACQSYF